MDCNCLGVWETRTSSCMGSALMPWGGSSSSVIGYIVLPLTIRKFRYEGE